MGRGGVGGEEGDLGEGGSEEARIQIQAFVQYTGGLPWPLISF